MRLKSLMGLLAIGGAVAYAQKRRGGELSMKGFKKTFDELFGARNERTGAMRTGVRASDDELPSYSSGRAGTSARSTSSSDYGSSSGGNGIVGGNK